jgi:hypothetical protein
MSPLNRHFEPCHLLVYQYPTKQLSQTYSKLQMIAILIYSLLSTFVVLRAKKLIGDQQKIE